METKVSIMITCYNLESVIDRAINSVIQMEKPFKWELLIGDDGSDDGTVECINHWINKYPDNIRLFIMDRSGTIKKNGTRAAQNRAKLLEEAKGEYLIFLDGDDEFIGKEKLVRQVDILDNPQYRSCSCVAHNILAHNITDGTIYPVTNEDIGDGIIETKKYLKYMYFHTNTILFRKECKKMMLKKEYRNYLNDNFITYIILQYGQIYYLHNIWAKYNLTGSGLWTGNSKTYGYFRNIILLDLEQSINPRLKKVVFERFASSLKVVFDYYSEEEKEIITPLIEELKTPLFRYTMLMYHSIDSSFVQKQKLIYLKVKVYWVLFYRMIKKKIMRI